MVTVSVDDSSLQGVLKAHVGWLVLKFSNLSALFYNHQVNRVSCHNDISS